MTVISQYNKYFREENEFIPNKVRNTFFQYTHMYPSLKKKKSQKIVSHESHSRGFITHPPTGTTQELKRGTVPWSTAGWARPAGAGMGKGL